MFQLIGLSEKAGSGMPHILAAWTAQHWRQPELRELFNPAAVELDLRMISLFPSDVLDDLVKGFPDFQHLSDTERVAVATAKVEERVTNRRIRELTELDRHSVGQMLRKLVAEGFLSPRGRRGGRYYELGDPEEGQGNLDLFPGPPEESEGSESETSEEDLRQIASKVRDTGRANPKVVRKTIAELCQGRFLSIRQLAELLGREPSTLRTHYLPAMVKEGVLRVQYPDNLSHPAQAYRTVQTPSD
jgi:ATP-dependent DNA helicase RecG